MAVLRLILKVDEATLVHGIDADEMVWFLFSRKETLRFDFKFINADCLLQFALLFRR